MRLLLQAFDDPCEEATVAVVHFDPDQVLQRRELLQMVKSKDPEIVKLSFWDGSLSFFGIDLEEIDQKLHDDFEAENDQWIVLPERIETQEWNGGCSTDCEMMVLHDNVVSWQAYPKYGSPGILTTASLSYEQVMKLKEESDGDGEAHS